MGTFIVLDLPLTTPILSGGGGGKVYLEMVRELWKRILTDDASQTNKIPMTY